MLNQELDNFIEGKEVEWRGEELVMYLEPEDLPEFAEALGNDFLADDGLTVILSQDAKVVVVLNDIFNEWELTEILPND